MPFKEQEQFDKEYKKELFENITQFSSKIDENIRLIEKSSKYTNIKTKLPNIATNLNSKLLLDIFPKFIKANLYFGSTTSILGEAIIFDLIERVTNGIESLDNYSSSLSSKHSTALVKVSPIRNVFSRIRTLFTGDIFTKEQLKNANMHIKDYKAASKSVCDYSLEKDLPTSILAYFKDNHFPKYMVLELLEDDINPSMQKLELSHIIPEIKTQILNDKEYCKNDFLNTIKTPYKNKLKKHFLSTKNKTNDEDLSK